VEFSSIIFTIDHWVASSQLKLYLFPDEFIYLSERFTRLGPIEVKGEEVSLVEKIVHNRKNN
jgi:hypothetical protein